MAKSKNIYDIIIVGGGLSGLTLACLLGAQKFSVLILDRDKPSKNKTANRATALSHGTSLVLKEAGVWDKIEKLACPIHKIDILDGNSPVLMDFLSREVDNTAFGHNIENHFTLDILVDQIAKLKTVTHVTGESVTSLRTTGKTAIVTTSGGDEFSAQLVIGADGRNSFIRECMNVPTHGWSYEQTALAGTFEHSKPHHHTAIEHFRREGPLAILPLRDDGKKHRSSFVWTVETRDAKPLLGMDEDTFTIALSARIPESYGTVKLASKLMSFPLSLQHAHEYTGERIALIADAAHGMHPIAGQGLNMGMRDIKALADILVEAKNEKEDLGSDNILQNYQRTRRFDNMTMMAATDALNKLFSNELPFVGPLRRLGISLVNRSPTAKRFFMHQAMGLKAGLKAGRDR